MKGFRLSKTSWLILSTGVFLVILVGLGLTRSAQIKQQASLDDELKTSQTILDKVQTADLQQQLQDLQDQVDEASSQVDEARQRLHQTVISADVAEKFYDIAGFSNVEITNISTSMISGDSVAGVGLSTITINAVVQGELNDIVNFVINLNNGYTTGFVTSVSVSVADSEESGVSMASIQMSVYSYEEKQS
jgi:vacuolar-type H+-ATPase subunit D/Vma8